MALVAKQKYLGASQCLSFRSAREATRMVAEVTEAVRPHMVSSAREN